jgi:hypothetical protein
MRRRVPVLAATAVSLALIGASTAVAVESGLFGAARPETAGTLAPVLSPDPGPGPEQPSTAAEPPTAQDAPAAIQVANEPDEDSADTTADRPHPEGRNDDD